MRTLVTPVLIALAAVSCGGKSNPPPSPGGSDDAIPVTPGQRVGWSQTAPSQDALRAYRFVLFVDEARMPLADANCVPAGTNFECTAALPSFSAGRHLLQMATMDASTGRESPRSPQLVVNLSAASTRGSNVSSTIDLTGSPSAQRVPAAPDDSVESPVKGRACSAGHPPVCFSVSTVADGVSTVERMIGLPDGRLLVLFAREVVQILPSGTAERLRLERRGEDPSIADLAIDPDFPATRFVYVATVNTKPRGRSTVDIVRMREVADHLGEATVIAAELPAASRGRPAISIGPDRRLYLALPGSEGTHRDGGPYDGLVLRLTADGKAAGHERMASPILAMGSARPAGLAWANASRLLIASEDGDMTLGVVPLVEADAPWPPATLPVATSGSARPAGTLTQVVAQSAPGAPRPQGALFMLTTNPDALYFARLAMGTGLEVLTVDPVPLGAWKPKVVAVDARGDAIVFIEGDGPESRGRLVRLHSAE